MANLARYLAVLTEIKKERGEKCEGCGMPAKHGHHIIPVSETSIASELVFEPANILILCDDCHALMHPNLRNISDWVGARKRRGRDLDRPSCSPKIPDTNQPVDIIARLLEIELARLDTAVKIEKERKIVFPETSIIIHDILKLQNALKEGKSGHARNIEL